MSWINTGNLEVDNQLSQQLPNFESHTLNVIGFGISIIETSRIKELVQQPKDDSEIQYFTVRERITSWNGVKRIQYLAGRFAAKQAVLKAIGRECYQSNIWLDIEIQRLSTGEPSVILHGKCQEIAAKLGVNKWLVSISHEDSYAAASAIAVGCT
ncbi:holo-ACP synthase [Fischerella thermalis]|uniref:Holo-[acyl-carrier-protein] synthase n=2 Tax=Fischerella TaxID=1190 RepID=A0A2N6LI45_9CYAN|nr:holo-ACP synthase [Fischerella thermalis]ACN96035.1 probable holo-acyl-carrier-protein synthase [Fischerella sp. MV11]PMB23823.1 ACP synthase [Fischerella thermalis CCMEE 5318]PMB32037.1 ACP synthase [Fischerella thermalis CCMEE 5319]